MGGTLAVCAHNMHTTVQGLQYICEPKDSPCSASFLVDQKHNFETSIHRNRQISLSTNNFQPASIARHELELDMETMRSPTDWSSAEIDCLAHETQYAQPVLLMHLVILKNLNRSEETSQGLPDGQSMSIISWLCNVKTSHFIQTMSASGSCITAGSNRSGKMTKTFSFVAFRV